MEPWRDPKVLKKLIEGAKKDGKSLGPAKGIEVVTGEPDTRGNKIKTVLKRQLDQQLAKPESQNRVDGYLQRGHHTDLANGAKDWARHWRQQALKDLPDSVASIERQQSWLLRGPGRSVRWEYLVFRDKQGKQLLAVIPRYNGSTLNYIKMKPLGGKQKSLKRTLARVSKRWKTRKVK